MAKRRTLSVKKVQKLHGSEFVELKLAVIKRKGTD